MEADAMKLLQDLLQLGATDKDALAKLQAQASTLLATMGKPQEAEQGEEPTEEAEETPTEVPKDGAGTPAPAPDWLLQPAALPTAGTALPDTLPGPGLGLPAPDLPASTVVLDSPALRSLNIAVLVSEPLVVADGDQTVSVDPVDFHAEKTLIVKALRDAARKVRVRFQHATTEALQRVLHEGCEVLHFIGHGGIEPEDYILLENIGAGHVIDSPTLSRLFGTASRHALRAVFVASCHSRSIGELFLAAGAQHVVCVHREARVMDKATRVFASAFYQALLLGNGVVDAFESARERVGADADLPAAERDKFLLLTNPAAPVSSMRPLFEGAAAGDWVDLSTETPSAVPARVHGFVGRRKELFDVVAAVHGQRLVTVRGPPGIGKTSIAVQVSHYVLPRHYFHDGVLFVPLRGVATVEGVVFAIVNEMDACFSPTKPSAPSTASAPVARHKLVRRLVADLKPYNLLLVLDNMEDILHEDPGQSRAFLEAMFNGCPEVTVLVTSRRSIGGGIGGVPERVVSLSRLPPLAAAQLFARRLPRSLTKSELFQGVSPPKDGDRRLFALECLSKHPIMTYLDGHPQAIALATPLLQDRTLGELSALLLSEAGVSTLSVPDIPDGQRSAVDTLVKSLSTSLEQLRKRDPVAVAMFHLLGTLPGGVLNFDLEGIFVEPLAFGMAFATEEGDVDTTTPPIYDASDAVSVNSADTVGTIGTTGTATTTCSASVVSIASSSYGGGGARHRPTGLWKEAMAALVRASLVERRQWAGDATHSSCLQWVSTVEGWPIQAVAASPAVRSHVPDGVRTPRARFACRHFSQFPFVADFAAGLVPATWGRTAEAAGAGGAPQPSLARAATAPDPVVDTGPPDAFRGRGLNVRQRLSPRAAEPPPPPPATPLETVLRLPLSPGREVVAAPPPPVSDSPEEAVLGPSPDLPSPALVAPEELFPPPGAPPSATLVRTASGASSGYTTPVPGSSSAGSSPASTPPRRTRPQPASSPNSRRVRQSPYRQSPPADRRKAEGDGGKPPMTASAPLHALRKPPRRRASVTRLAVSSGGSSAESTPKTGPRRTATPKALMPRTTRAAELRKQHAEARLKRLAEEAEASSEATPDMDLRKVDKEKKGGRAGGDSGFPRAPSGAAVSRAKKASAALTASTVAPPPGFFSPDASPMGGDLPAPPLAPSSTSSGSLPPQTPRKHIHDDVMRYGSSAWRLAAMQHSGEGPAITPAAAAVLRGRSPFDRVRLTRASVPVWLSPPRALRCELLLRCVVHFRFVTEWVFLHLPVPGGGADATAAALLELQAPNVMALLGRHEELLRMCGLPELGLLEEEAGEEEDDEEEEGGAGEGGSVVPAPMHPTPSPGVLPAAFVAASRNGARQFVMMCVFTTQSFVLAARPTDGVRVAHDGLLVAKHISFQFGRACLLKASGLAVGAAGASKANAEQAKADLCAAQALFRALRVDEGEAASWAALAALQLDTAPNAAFEALEEANRIYKRLHNLGAQVLLLRLLGDLCGKLPNRFDEAQAFFVEHRRVRGDLYRLHAKNNTTSAPPVADLMELAVVVP